ncbi:uncharacterized protein L969DRAFT_42669 [Mixia osmundae IAM 14324]|uniref:serine--tRNA ligase n=1 Tax=Mixia osmundae (strain CBS 9802 / IAM 14324 / JCM 22182 / KY 12970) TaxID=764103 RepID=G7E7A1_MIXOS|nr:uncharacterized protein L969DRAFT_42669 [Mixia osmundae IAM 14324]KEI41896.1 hypothetical protein L969DRAFT_42669 [Mixia osmundae IAM 14324]GAA98711.1 hypothetical protein E5Q_05399 [Mixia osmundae IAM 14324]
MRGARLAGERLAHRTQFLRPPFILLGGRHGFQLREVHTSNSRSTISSSALEDARALIDRLGRSEEPFQTVQPDTDWPDVSLNRRKLATLRETGELERQWSQRRAHFALGAYDDSERTKSELSDWRSLESDLNKLIGRLQIELKCTRSDDLLAMLKTLKPHQTQCRSRLRSLQARYNHEALQTVNLSHPDSPIGNETNNRVVRTFGTAPARGSPDPSRDHLALAARLRSQTLRPSWLDPESGLKTTGTRFYFLRGEAAVLESALINYAISTVTAADDGWQYCTVPDIIKTSLAERCGFLPRDDASQTYFVSTGASVRADERHSLALAGTAEIPLAGSSSGVHPLAALPLKALGLGRAFRSEAGSRGLASRGLYRVHQFSKLEMYVVCRPDKSDEMLEELVALQETILVPLGLTLRTLDMATEELGASAYRKYDIEAWMSGRGDWGELASASNCTDYQARRLGIQYQPEPADGKKLPLEYAHTLNATALAVPRVILALIEQGLHLDGDDKHFALPAVLRPFWLGKHVIASDDGDVPIRWIKREQP